MSESKAKASLLVSLTLTPSQRVALNSVLNFVNRCGPCGTIATQGEGALQIKRFNQILEDLDLFSIDDLPKPEQQLLAAKNAPEDASIYSLKLEHARHLLTIIEAKARYSSGAPYLLAPVLSSLEAQVPKPAAEMDAEATAEEKPPVGRFLLTLSPEEREFLIKVYFTTNACLTCGCVTDGPTTRKDIYLFASLFKTLQLEAFFDKSPEQIDAMVRENPVSIDVVIDLNEATYAHDLIYRRVGFVPKAPRKLAAFLKSIEEIKGGTYERKAPEPQPLIREDVVEKERVFPSASA